MWDITEGDPMPHRFETAQTAQLGTTTTKQASVYAGSSDAKNRVMEFWQKERDAMNAMKVEHDLPKAIKSFRAALELNPDHEDSHYYLGNCLALQGDPDGALDHLKQLIEINPQS